MGVLAHPGQMDVRITAKAANPEAALALIGPVELEVRELLGDHIFAADDQTMDEVVSQLLRQKGLSIAVYEDLTAGMTAQRLQQAGQEQFVEGTIGSGETTIRRILASAGKRLDRINELLPDDAALTDELAQAVRAHSETDLGLAVHVVPQGDRRADNLG